jgi:hypothetical protein
MASVWIPTDVGMTRTFAKVGCTLFDFSKLFTYGCFSCIIQDGHTKGKESRPKKLLEALPNQAFMTV